MPLRTPPDFGLSVIVTAILGGVVVLVIACAATVPTRGPQGESHAPESTNTYIEFQAPAAQPSTILPQR